MAVGTASVLPSTCWHCSPGSRVHPNRHGVHGLATGTAVLQGVGGRLTSTRPLTPAHGATPKGSWGHEVNYQQVLIAKLIQRATNRESSASPTTTQLRARYWMHLRSNVLCSVRTTEALDKDRTALWGNKRLVRFHRMLLDSWTAERNPQQPWTHGPHTSNFLIAALPLSTTSSLLTPTRTTTIHQNVAAVLHELHN